MSSAHFPYRPGEQTSGQQPPAQSPERLSPQPPPHAEPADGEQHPDGNGARSAVRCRGGWGGRGVCFSPCFLLLSIQVFVLRKFSVQNRRFFLVPLGHLQAAEKAVVKVATRSLKGQFAARG